MNTISHQYIANWHDGFVDYIGCLLGVVAGLMVRPESSEEDKKALEEIKMMLDGRDAQDVERDLVDTCLEHAQMNPLAREFWKQLFHIKIERDKASEKERLSALQIPVLEG